MLKGRDTYQTTKSINQPFGDDDEEAQLEFMSSKGPSNDVSTPVHRVVKEVKRNWWLWGAVCFALVLITGVVMFRHKLYNTGNIGLPFLAVKENAAETCASKCRLSSADDSLLSAEEPRDVKTKQEYDACYSKCVAQETKEVAEEREKFKENEEKWEKKVEETMGQQATASDAKAAKVDKSLNKNALSSSTSADDVLLDDIPEGLTDR